MKVVLSVDPIKFPLTGIGRYTYELAKGLKDLDDVDDLYFLKGYRLSKKILIDDGGGVPPKSSISMSYWKKKVSRNSLAIGAYRRLNSWLKSKALHGLEDHIFHGTNYYLPPFGGKSVVTIHDLSPYLWVETHPPERVQYMQAEIEASLKRADAIITDTEYTREEIIDFFNWTANKVYAVHLAAGPEFFPRKSEEVARELRVFGLVPGGYSLFTGTLEPRKNISMLLDAYARLPKKIRMRWPLVLVGYRGWAGSDLYMKIEKAQNEGWLRYLGFVSQHLLPLLMAGARLFVYPSKYEGFGLPVLEAMACGVPVVCSNAASLPEVSGGAAAMHDPQDIDALFDLLAAGLEDEIWRARARAAGLHQARKFSWSKCTKDTLTVYRSIS